MRAVFSLFTALPIDADPDEIGVGWVGTTVVGLVLGVAWLVFHQAFLRLGGPLVAAGGVLLLHVAVTGGRPWRGIAGVAKAVTATPSDPGSARGLPDVGGAAAAVITLMLLIAFSFLIRVDVAPAVMVLVPLVGKSAQALLLGSGDRGVGLMPPTAAQKVMIAVTTGMALAVPAALAPIVRPVRVDPPVAGLLEYILLGVLAVLVTMAVGMLARAWLRARFGQLDANGWHAVGAVTELTALAVVSSRLG